MKRIHPNITKNIFPILILVLFYLLSPLSSYSQGYNDNEWIFGYCGPNEDNNYISFGRGENPTVLSLPGSQPLGNGNVAIAIDPLNGEPLFYTDGALVYNYLNEPMQGVVGELGGMETERQTVAIGELDYEPQGGNKLFYTFYITPGGQLEYAIMDMNDQGGAPSGQPPAGAVTPGGVIGPAQGFVTVVNGTGVASEISFLVSFENGEIVTREIHDQAGQFPNRRSRSFPFTPKASYFIENTNVDRGTLFLIPEGSGGNLALVNINTDNGTFGSVNELPQTTGNGEPFGGFTVTPSRDYIYYSQGGNLYRLSSPDETPELVPLPNPVEEVQDLKVGPDGQLYYIYKEPGNDAYNVGTITNPDEPDIQAVEIDEDPFQGADFCGTTFPQFAPNMDGIGGTVDFTWSPDTPCTNNPLQLTSSITPANTPVDSFEWSINPPPTDQDGEEIELDLSEEHLLLPSNATGEQNISVSLNVTFQDGSQDSVTYDITFQENNLQANFTPSDTTTCNTCVDLNEMLEAQSGEEGQGGGTGGGGIGGGTGGGQGGGQTNFEYFWSNKKEEGWIGEGANEVCEPGQYWVLVREPGSSCYVYAQTRVKMWDPATDQKIDDQTNSIWYFGENGGLDFNQDPDDPNGVVPRPVEDPGFEWNLPAGTTTISDQTGQVLFYTDGESVWDLNGNTMQGGDDIGGDNTSSQSVVAVQVPQEESMYYLFTTQSAGGGSNEVKFSLIDLKGENPNGVGSVVSEDNFLFSPGTEQAAALTAGDTTWMMFHEMGNNTFRAYPVTGEGIGQAVFSSVGSDHNFGTGVGTMKFSPDGSKLAVTINDGGENKVEIFDFDADTGTLTTYASIDLMSNDEVYGLEFSNDGQRVFVSYRDGGGIQELPITGGSTTDNTDPDNPVTQTCPSCFENATTREAIEQCISSNITTLSQSSGQNLGALQVGPDGQIYVSIVGAGQVGQIQAGSDCNNSTYQPDGPLTGGTNGLGLPSFVQNSGSSIPDPALEGPDRLCLSNGEALGEFDAGGEPDIDSYFWSITDADGNEIHTFEGVGEDFQTMEYPFDSAGVYTVSLEVERCRVGFTIHSETKEVEVLPTPVITLQDDVTFCAGTSVTLTAIDGYDESEDLYNFQWTNAAGQILGDNTSNSIEIDEESIYTVNVSYKIPAGADSATYETCSVSSSVFAGPAFDFELNQSAEESCYEENHLNFAPNTPVSGQWAYQQQGDTTPPTSLGEGFELDLNVSNLPGPGVYEIIFTTEDPILEDCIIEKRDTLTVHPLPEFSIEAVNSATNCNSLDGSFEILMISDADSVQVLETGDLFTEVSAGNTLTPITNLDPGVYTVRATLGSCDFIQTVNIINENPPFGFSPSVVATPESCGPDGILEGVLDIEFPDPAQSGDYVIIKEDDGSQLNGSFTGSISLPLSDGTYAVEISDPDDCAVPFDTVFVVESSSLVQFSIPTETIACEVFVFQPQSSEDLNYIITDPNGTEISPDANGDFTLGTSGTYLVKGEAADPTSGKCPRTRELNLTLSEQVVYEVSPPTYQCNSPVSRRSAILAPGFDAADYRFFWRNSAGQIVQMGQFFSTSQRGEFSLDVQPIVGAACPAPPITFQATPYEYEAEITLNADSGICFGENQTTITADIDIDLGGEIRLEWHRVINGSSTQIPEFDNLTEITVDQPGTYQAFVINETPELQCIIGTEEIDILQSNSQAPVLENSYTICAIEGVSTTLDSLGNWAEYEWMLGGEVVSTDSTFTPTEPGNYDLILTDAANCQYALSFEVLEDCELKVTIPTGLVPEDPERNFEVYVNDFVDEISVLIYNRWGELIYHCIEENVTENSQFCEWNGMVNGKKVPVGTYPVIVKYKSQNQGLEKTIKKAIVVVE